MTDFLTLVRKPRAVGPLERAVLYADERGPATRYRIKMGQRFHRVGYTAVVWQVVSVYRDSQGLEHASLVDETGRLDEKTLSASVLLDRTQYRLI